MEKSILDQETFELLMLMEFIPEVFKEVFIFESDDVEDFDIGFCGFYLLTRKDIVVQGYEFLENPYRLTEKLREKYSISLEKPSIAEQDGCDVIFFEKKMISKPRNLKGDPEEGLAIKPKIKKGLQEMNVVSIDDSEMNISAGWKALNIGGPVSRCSWSCMFCGAELRSSSLQQPCGRCGRLNMRRDPGVPKERDSDLRVIEK